jgi:hypothetical protein
MWAPVHFEFSFILNLPIFEIKNKGLPDVQRFSNFGRR